MIYWVLRAVAWLWLKLCFRLQADGAGNVPAAGGVILAGNHASFLDPMAIGCATRRRLHFLARGSLAGSRLYRFLTRRLPIVPIERGIADREALRRVVAVLRSGGACVQFPEGTRSSDGRIGELRAGVVLMAREASVPVVPVVVSGAFEAWPRHRRLPRWRGRIAVRFGEGLDLAALPRDEALQSLRAAWIALGASAAPVRGQAALRAGTGGGSATPP